jgi:hypothetical protein
VILADREMVESASDDILEGAEKLDVAFLVVGDPFGYLAASGIDYWVVWGSLVPGLQLTPTLSYVRVS